MLDILFLLPVCIVIGIAAFSVLFMGNKITPIEAVTQVLLLLLIMVPLWSLGRYSDAADTELWNGELTKKEIQRQNCPYGWQDWQDGFCTEYDTRRVKDGPPRRVCTTDSKGKKSCHYEQDYKTQYKYDFPWEQKFYMYSNVKEIYGVARVDRQGAIIPPDYIRHYVGEPVAAAKGYTNWIRAASQNVFHEDGVAEEKYRGVLPDYPLGVYDYFKVNRVVKVGNVEVPADLNDKLAEALKSLGPNKQMNAVIVVADAKLIQADFSNALRRYWMGFKKNDAVVFIGLDGQNLAWAEVMSWSKKSIFDIELRDALLQFKGKPMNFNAIPANLLVIGLRDYERREMKEFEYLKDQIPVPNWLTIMVIIISLGGSAGLTWFFHRVEFDPLNAIARRM